MVKELIKRTLLLASIMILVVFFVSYLYIGAVQVIVLVFELVFLSFVINVIRYLIKKALFNSFLVNLGVEYLSVSVFVLLYGYFVEWFNKANWWMVFLYVAMVYIPAYFLDMGIVKRDINFINHNLERRRQNANETNK